MRTSTLVNIQRGQAVHELHGLKAYVHNQRDYHVPRHLSILMTAFDAVNSRFGKKTMVLTSEGLSRWADACRSSQPALNDADLRLASFQVKHSQQPQRPPLAWFLPGPIRIRGGLARHLASAWLFHRGIHLESTLASFCQNYHTGSGT
jgi:hypothetical protein